MSLTSVVFSKDRPMQLDLLLRSLSTNGADLCDRIIVLQAPTDDLAMLRAYTVCADTHPDVGFWIEADFQRDLLDALFLADDYVTFFTDDSVLYRDLAALPAPEEALDADEDVLFFSLRLGQQCGQCYPLRRLQGLPEFTTVGPILTWPWRTGDADWGYAGSVDGHVFRTRDVLDWLEGQTFSGPNELEETLVRGVAGALRPLGACYPEQHLVTLAVNRVQTLRPNRAAETHGYEPADLCERYLAGERVSLEELDFGNVTAAHAEVKLVFA